MLFARVPIKTDLLDILLEEPERKALVQLDLLGVPLALQLSVVGEDLVDNWKHVAGALLEIYRSTKRSWSHRSLRANSFWTKLCLYVLSTNMICLMDGNSVVRNIGKWPGSPLQGPSTWEAVWAPDKECVNTLCLKIQSWQNCFKNLNLTTCQHQHHLSRNLKQSMHQRYLSQSWMPSS